MANGGMWHRCSPSHCIVTGSLTKYYVREGVLRGRDEALDWVCVGLDGRYDTSGIALAAKSNAHLKCTDVFCVVVDVH
jgi:hypothetical protein